MAFQLSKAEFRSVSHQNPSYKRGVQEVVLTISGLNTDVDLDIGDAAGTFWTAAQADATYGAMSALVLAKLQAVVAGSSYCSGIRCPELELGAYAKVASAPGANQFSSSIDTYGPDLLMHAGDAPLAYHVHVFYEMAAGQFPVSAAYNL